MSEKSRTPFLTSLAHHAADPFRLLIESIVDYAIYMVDPGGMIASWNTGAERIYGYKATEIIGQPFSSVYSEADRASGKSATIWAQLGADGHIDSRITASARTERNSGRGSPHPASRTTSGTTSASVW